MADNKKPTPKTQKQLSEESFTAYANQGIAKTVDNRKREYQRSVKGDNAQHFSLGLKDIDESIFFYFNNVIKPSVVQNSTVINVPVIYGSPERWKSVQQDGFYRDAQGKIQAPLIMVKRDSMEKNRTLGNKLDANSPNNVGIFEKKYSQKNVYDRFNLVNNRIAVKEYQGVVIPDYVNITYSCIVFTEYMEQMNKLVEAINYSSDAYWGDPEKFSFRAMIDNYTLVTELTQGKDRAVKTSFNIKLLGHIVPDTINAQLKGSLKYFSKSSVSFKVETEGSTELLVAKSNTPEKGAPTRFYDNLGTAAPIATAGMTTEQITYLGTNTTAIADTIGASTALFTGATFAAAPLGFSITQDDFMVYVNGILQAGDVRTVVETGSGIEVVFTALDYPIVQGVDQVVLIGKFNQ